MFFYPGKSLQTFSLRFSLWIEFYLTGKEEMKVEGQNFFTINTSSSLLSSQAGLYDNVDNAADLAFQ